MHAKQNKSHGQQVKVLPMNDVPLIGGQRLVDVHIREEAKWKNDDSQVNPAEEQHKDGKCCEILVLLDVGLEIEPAASHEDVTGIMNDQNHDSCCNFIAHHRKQN